MDEERNKEVEEQVTEETKAEARKARNKKEFRWLKITFFVLVAMVLTATATATIMIRIYGGSENMEYVSKFGVLLNSIEEYYIGEADLDAATDMAYTALVDAATDRWSYYMTAEAYQSYSDYSQNQYQGIGITVETDTEAVYMLTISAVEAGSPAEQAGMEVGDVILSADNQDCAGMEISDLKAIIQAHMNQTLDISVKRNGETVVLSVTCTMVQTDPVSYALLEDNVGYIKVKNFEDGSSDSFVEAIDTLLKQGATAMVFDMRSNPGGQLSELLEMLDYLLPEGEMFVSVNQKGDEKVYCSDENCLNLPMAVMINSDSYSAAEFFAAALWEYELAVTVGQPTTGKGRSQITVGYTDGSALHISSKRYLTPNRIDLSEQGGLTPDIAVALSEEEAALFASGQLRYEADPQLQAAVAAVK